MAEYGLSSYDASALTQSLELADYFETTAKGCNDAKLAANWLMGGFAAMLNKHELDISASPVPAAALTGLLVRIKDNTISSSAAKDVLDALWNGEGSADEIIEKKGLKQISDTGAIEAMIDEIISNNPGQVAEYRSGKDKVFGFFVGQCMKKSAGQGNPKIFTEILTKKLSD